MPEEIDDLIEITDDDGSVIKCRLYDIIEFENKHYALLIEGETDDGDPEVVLMRYIEDGDESLFEVIEDDDEFNRVSDYIDSLDEEFEDDDEEEE